MAKTKDGEPDHKTRIAYMKLAIEINCWSADARMKIRNHIRQIERDRMEFEVKMGRPIGGNGFSISDEARREMRR